MRFLGLILAWFYLSMASLLGQEIAAYEKEEWERKENREEVARIYYGQGDVAIANMQAQLAQQGDEKDPELYFGLSLAYSHKKNSKEAFRYFQRALEAGLPMSRFLTTLPGFETLHKHKDFVKLAKAVAHRPVHGPVLGAVDDKGCKVWLRTWGAAPVVVKAFTSETATRPVAQWEGETSSQSDYTAVAQFDGLLPNTRYFYRVEINGRDAAAGGSFKTLPKEGEPGIFTIGFGGCSAYNPAFERIWDTIAVHNLDVFLTLGDNVYSNHHTLPQVHRFCYYQRQSRPEFQRFTAHTPYFGIWDDHDFGENDSYGGPQLYTPQWKMDVLNVFKQNFANPYFATDDLPGIWFDYKVGDVHFFMLDGRYYREPSTQEAPSMLGPAQKAWLKRELLKSDATFKVLVSPVAWAQGAKGTLEGRIDTWDGYKSEREEIFSFLTEHQVSGVFLLSADRHRHDVWKNHRPNDYDLYEFTSSRLTNIHYHLLMPEALFGYNEKNGFAKLIFNTQAEQPYVVYQVYSIDNELIQMIRVYQHQMVNVQ